MLRVVPLRCAGEDPRPRAVRFFHTLESGDPDVEGSLCLAESPRPAARAAFALWPMRTGANRALDTRLACQIDKNRLN